MKKITKEWMEFALQDLDDMEYLYFGRRYAGSTYFAHQSIEKILKAYIIEVYNIRPKKIHNLPLLVSNAKLLNDLETEDLIRLRELTVAYGIVRYPDISQMRYNRKYQVIEFIKLSRKLFKWIRKKLENN